jgi:hypothetical protein
MVDVTTTEPRSLSERRTGDRTASSSERRRPRRSEHGDNGDNGTTNGAREERGARYADESDSGEWSPAAAPHGVGKSGKTVRMYAFGVARNRLQQAARRLHVPVIMTDDPGQVDMIVTLKNYYRRRPKLIVDAERRGTPIYVLRANTITQMENFLIDVFQKEVNDEALDPSAGLNEARDAIARVRGGLTNTVDLTPQPAAVRRAQHEMIRMAKLEGESIGNEPDRFVRIVRKSDE